MSARASSTLEEDLDVAVSGRLEITKIVCSIPSRKQLWRLNYIPRKNLSGDATTNQGVTSYSVGTKKTLHESNDLPQLVLTGLTGINRELR